MPVELILEDGTKTGEDEKAVYYEAQCEMGGTKLNITVKTSVPNYIRLQQFYWDFINRNWTYKKGTYVFVFGEAQVESPDKCCSYCPKYRRGIGTVHIGYYAFRAEQQFPPFEKSKVLVVKCTCEEEWYNGCGKAYMVECIDESMTCL